MAFLAIVHIPDHTATNVVDQVHTMEQIYGAQVVGLFEFPHRRVFSCTGCVRKGSGAWTRDPAGFIKCGICGNRPKHIRRNLIGHLFDWFGANLLGHDAPALFRTPDGYDSTRRTDPN